MMALSVMDWGPDGRPGGTARRFEGFAGGGGRRFDALLGGASRRFDVLLEEMGEACAVECH